jgi:predicted enzyme related to lactoylglutathione lyase
VIDVNGMTHVILTVSQYDEAKEFYSKLMTAMKSGWNLFKKPEAEK